MKFTNRKKQQKIQQSNKSSYLFVALSILVVIPVALVISTSIKSSHSAAVLTDLETEIKALEREVRSIESDIVESTSLSDVSKEVESLGFSSPEQLVYIQKDSPVASLR